MSDAIRVWMLSQLRIGWREGLAGVVLDRGVGVGVLIVIGFVTLVNTTSAFTTLSGYRRIVLLIFGAILVSAVGALICARGYAWILRRWRITRWIGKFVLASRHVLVESPASLSIVTIAFCVHFLNIACIWSIAQAFSMSLSLIQAAALFTLMVAVAIVPILGGRLGAARTCGNSVSERNMEYPRSRRCSFQSATASRSLQRACREPASRWSIRLARCNVLR